MLRDEETLRVGLVQGSHAAMEELARQLERPLMNFLYRQLGDLHAAEDVFQETLIRVIRHAREFRPRAKLSTWIFTIARNLAMDHLRSRKRKREVSLGEVGTVLTLSPLENDDESRRLAAALATLSRPKRDAVALRFFADRSYEEIAEICGAPVGTVKFRVHQAIQDLAAALKARSPDRADGHGSGDSAGERSNPAPRPGIASEPAAGGPGGAAPRVSLWEPRKEDRRDAMSGSG